MPLWDKVKQELDRAGQVAQDALDEGRLRLEAHRARQSADKAAQTLGYAVYRARQAGGTLDDAELGRHVARVGEYEAEMKRLEAELAAIQRRWREGGGMGAPPASSTAGASYGDAGAGAGTPAGTSSAAYAAAATTAAATSAAAATAPGVPDVGPVGTPGATTTLETPPEASGGPVPPPANTPPETGTYGVIPPIDGVSGTAPETDKPTTDMWRKGDVYGHEPY